MILNAITLLAWFGNLCLAASVPRIGLFRRQSGTISIPTACESTCSNFISVWNACNENESTSACSEVCTTNYEQCLSKIAMTSFSIAGPRGECWLDSYHGFSKAASTPGPFYLRYQPQCLGYSGTTTGPTTPAPAASSTQASSLVGSQAQAQSSAHITASPTPVVSPLIETTSPNARETITPV
ncbi:hypothetical protein EHS25_001916 [Saitozyma podzolica]|uniref:Apple domain-containing protein n=1 Tax=Saitozyma podzolica TaxID=1890683 RepID=A0A427YFU0_9TREE|nr:hypothetical protein EHS25_001916 [Saitozyma podzolica]